MTFCIKATPLFVQQHVYNNTKKNIKTLLDICEGNPPLSGGFPSQRASNTESVSISWHHHAMVTLRGLPVNQLRVDLPQPTPDIDLPVRTRGSVRDGGEEILGAYFVFIHAITQVPGTWQGYHHESTYTVWCLYIELCGEAKEKPMNYAHISHVIVFYCDHVPVDLPISFRVISLVLRQPLDSRYTMAMEQPWRIWTNISRPTIHILQ